MTQSIAAAIHIQGPTVRYAALVREDDDLRLRRLGQRTFSDDVARLFWEENGGPDALDRVRTAVQDAFEGLDLTAFRVVLHPLDVYSFFAPVPAGLSPEEQERYVTPQAALVTGARSPDSLRLSLRPVRTVEMEGEVIEWMHVLALPRAAADRVDSIVEALPVEETARMVSTEAAARLLGHAEEQDAAPESPYSLAIGMYPSHTEYALTRGRAWVHAHASQEARTLDDRVYYAVGGLHRAEISIEAVDRLFVYGPDADPEAAGPFEDVFECSAHSLDPFALLPQLAERPQKQEPPGLHVPCIGGALEVPTATAAS